MQPADLSPMTALTRAISEAGAAAVRFWHWISDTGDGTVPVRPGPHVQGSVPKFFQGSTEPESAGQPTAPAIDLPRAYGRDRVALLPRDPRWLFAFWEITPETRVTALRSLGVEAEGAQEILRVYETDDDAREPLAVQDVELAAGADSWHIEIGRPGHTFVVEVGLRTTSGRFLSLARSNEASTPPQAVSADLSVEWADLGSSDAGASDPGTREAHRWSGRRLEPGGAATDATSPAGSPTPPRG